MAWTRVPDAFGVEANFKTGNSIIATERDSRAHFMLHQYDAVLDRKLILLLKILSYNIQVAEKNVGINSTASCSIKPDIITHYVWPNPAVLNFCEKNMII